MKRNLFLGHVGQQNIWFNFRAWSWESTGSKVTKDTFSETMGDQDSYRETFVLWVGNTQVSGSDHSGEFRIGGRGQVNCNTLWEKWTCLQLCKHGCLKVKGIYITKKLPLLPTATDRSHWLWKGRSRNALWIHPFRWIQSECVCSGWHGAEGVSTAGGEWVHADQQHVYQQGPGVAVRQEVHRGAQDAEAPQEVPGRRWRKSVVGLGVINTGLVWSTEDGLLIG
jgi:hypothetical protein